MTDNQKIIRRGTDGKCREVLLKRTKTGFVTTKIEIGYHKFFKKFDEANHHYERLIEETNP